VPLTALFWDGAAGAVCAVKQGRARLRDVEAGIGTIPMPRSNSGSSRTRWLRYPNCAVEDGKRVRAR